MTWYLNKPCLHDTRAVCVLCSDQDPRWREWRGGAEPPNGADVARRHQADNLTALAAELPRLAGNQPPADIITIITAAPVEVELPRTKHRKQMEKVAGAGYQERHEGLSAWREERLGQPSSEEIDDAWAERPHLTRAAVARQLRIGIIKVAN